MPCTAITWSASSAIPRAVSASRSPASRACAFAVIARLHPFFAPAGSAIGAPSGALSFAPATEPTWNRSTDGGPKSGTKRPPAPFPLWHPHLPHHLAAHSALRAAAGAPKNIREDVHAKHQLAILGHAGSRPEFAARC